MKKIVRIGTQFDGDIFCKIELKDNPKRSVCLSISGVIGPQGGGDCRGSCGQIYDSIQPRFYASNWNKETLNKFLTIWKEWHLNDMRAYTPEMKKAGWDKLATKEIFKYSFWFTDAARKEREQLEADIIASAISGQVIRLDERQKRLLGSKTYMDIYAYETPAAPEFMEVQTDCKNKKPKIERTTLGWVNIKDHPDGLLGRELNGEKYGCKWFFHELPKDVITFLESLPDTDKQPAWV